MELSKGTKVAIWAGSICLFHVIGMLVFRAFIYADMYIAPEDAYGISDLIELLLGAFFLVFLTVSILFSVVLFFKGNAQSKKSALYLVLFCLVLFFAYSPLHSIVAQSGG